MLAGIALHIGDGARLTRSLVHRTPTGRHFGHTSVQTQIGWCADARVKCAVSTHCGTGLVAGGRLAGRRVEELGIARDLVARLALDGLVLDV